MSWRLQTAEDTHDRSSVVLRHDIPIEGSQMCEFTVFLNDEKIFDDAIYAIAVNGNVFVRNILGEQKDIADCEINEINVLAEKLVLRATPAQ